MRVREVLRQVGLSGFEERSGMQLSGGQQQRVAVARGLVGEPGLLLMDEPFSNLDARLRDQMRTDLRRLQRRLGISILFVTHDQAEALALSDRIAIMRAGRIEQIGTPLELYARPQAPFVRDFLGHSILLPATSAAAAERGEVWAVRAAGRAVIEGRGANHLGARAPEAACLLAIRPEDVVVEAAGPARHGEPTNALDGRIVTLLFLGQHYDAVVELADGSTVVLQLPRSDAWAEGQAVMLHLPADRLQLWPPDAPP